MSYPHGNGTEESVRTPGRHRTESDRGSVYDLIKRNTAAEQAAPVMSIPVSPWFASDLSEVE